MRYLLLSVLVVCVIGIMIPSAFAETHIVTIEYDRFLNENPDHPWSKLGEITTCNEYSGTYGWQERTVCFSPSVLTIQDGDTVTWINNTVQKRTVTFSGATYKIGGPLYEDIKDESDSDYLSQGDSFSRTFGLDPDCFRNGAVCDYNIIDYVDIVGQTRAQEYDVGDGIIIIGCLEENNKLYHSTFHPRPEYCAQAVEEVDTEPAQQGSGGCGEGTTMRNGVCQLAQYSPGLFGGCLEGAELVSTEYGNVCQLTNVKLFSASICGEGYTIVDGVCQLTKTSGTSMSIEPLHIVIGVVAIGGIIGVIAVAKRGSKTPKPAKQELDEYEEQYIEEEEPRRKPARQIETSAFCDNCGKKLKPTAKFCGGCGNQV